MTKRIRESFGQRLARLRRERGITQEELAERLGVAQPNVSGYERDLYVPNALTVAQLAQVLTVTSDVLLGLEPAKGETGTLDRAVLRRLRKIDALSRRDRVAVLRTLDAFLDRGRNGRRAQSG